MAAGDGVTADFMFEVRLLPLGDGTNYHVVSVSGLEDQEVKTADLDLLGDGASPGVDRLAVRTVVLTVEMYDATPSTLQTRYEAFRTAWALGATTTLHWKLSGAKRYLNGRTRRFITDESLRTFGIITVIAEFVCTDPVIHT